MYRVREGRIIREWDLPREIIDVAHVPEIESPAFTPGEGPPVWIDAGHNVMHDAEGTNWAFGEMLRRDGFRVRTWTHVFTDSLPEVGDILVVSNALADRNAEDWSLPTPSAFSGAEVGRLAGWVSDGGRLLLIADHMPFPGGAADLGAAFGFEFSNGFAIDTATESKSQSYLPWTGSSTFTFRRADGSLVAHTILQGRSEWSRVDSVMTFTGQAFRSPAAAAALHGGFRKPPG